MLDRQYIIIIIGIFLIVIVIISKKLIDKYFTTTNDKSLSKEIQQRLDKIEQLEKKIDNENRI